MTGCPIARRMLLGRTGSGLAVLGTFLLPAGFAAASTRQPRHRARASSRARPPTPLVMLDPGHGGKDPGAIGVSGTYEKQIALATAFELRRLLEASGRYRVAMTRARGHVHAAGGARGAGAGTRRGAVRLHARRRAARPSVRGASVYTLAATASDAANRRSWPTARTAPTGSLAPGLRVSPEVARILASLVRRETRVGSARLARSVVGSLDNAVPMLTEPGASCRLRRAEGGRHPSVLVEMGFMSNPRDEAELRRPAHRVLVARAMRDAVDGYFAATGAYRCPIRVRELLSGDGRRWTSRR